VRYFHTTSAAGSILAEGFRDSTGSYMLAALTLTGVFLGDRPMDMNEGARGEQVLDVTLPSDVGLCEYELIEDEKPYREWCVPAALLNEHATIRLLGQEEVDEIPPRLGAAWE
jgi:hypothetical protein